MNPEAHPDESGDAARTGESPNRDSLPWLFHDPGVRNYLFAAFAALAMIFVILFSFGSLPGAAVIALLGVSGLLLRWASTPPLVLMILFWFLIFPVGLPPGYEDRYEIVQGRFRIADLMIVFCVLVYAACHYRLLGLSYQALPFDRSTRRKQEKPYRRPVQIISSGEIKRLLIFSGTAVLMGQIIWLFATCVEADPGSFIPLRFTSENQAIYHRASSSGITSPGVSRFIALTGFLFLTMLVARLIFSYWRLRRMGAIEARLVLQDEAWNELRREQMRIENWKQWAHKRNETATQPKSPRNRRRKSS